MVINADSPEALQRQLNKAAEIGDQIHMEISVTKTKVIVIRGTPKLNINIYDSVMLEC